MALFHEFGHCYDGGTEYGLCHTGRWAFVIVINEVMIIGSAVIRSGSGHAAIKPIHSVNKISIC